MEVIWRIFEVLVNIFENAVICYFLQKHFPGRFSKRTNNFVNMAAVTMIAGVYTAYLYFPPPWILDTVGLHAFWLLYILLFRRGLWYKKSFWSVLLISVTSICSVVVVSWAMYINGVSQNTIVFGQGVFRLLLIISSKAMQVMSLYYFSKIYVTSRAVHKNMYITLISLPILCSLIDNTLLDIGFAMGEDIYLIFYVALSALCVMAILMASYYLYYKISKQGDLLLRTQGELQHKTMMEQHNAELIKIDGNMRVWRHDFHNHLQTLLVLSRMCKNEELEDYIVKLGENLKELEGVVHTGQQALDAIVTVKYASAKADGITMNLYIMPIPPLPINDVDVTSLFGNLFDNAIESCRRVDVKERSIDLSLVMMGDMICIRMSNTTDGIERTENGRFLTTKKQDGLHGLGLASVDRIMSNAGGQVRREHKDCVFTTILLFPLNR